MSTEPKTAQCAADFARAEEVHAKQIGRDLATKKSVAVAASLAAETDTVAVQK